MRQAFENVAPAVTEIENCYFGYRKSGAPSGDNVDLIDRTASWNSAD